MSPGIQGKSPPASHSLRGVKLSKAPLISTFFLLLLVVPTALVAHCDGQAGKWFYWMEPGAYATLTLSAEELPHIPGVPGGGLGSRYSGLRFPNETQIGFENISLTWRVVEVREDEALVNYTVMLFDAYYAEPYMGALKFVSSIGDMQLLSTNVLVKMDTLAVYSENGTYIGRWPFWVHGHEVGSTVVMVHDVLTCDPKALFLNGSIVITHLNSTVGLVDLGDTCQHFGKDPESEGYNTTFGFFSANRLIGCALIMVRVDSGFVDAGPHFPAFYDKASLIMIVYDGGNYIDDVIRCVVGDIYIGIDLEKPLIIGDSNIDFKLQAEQEGLTDSNGFELPFVPVVSVAVTAVAAGGILYVWKKKRG